MIISFSAFCQNLIKTNCKMNMVRDIKTFVFLDIETTGLPRMENNKTKITELCMVAVEASHIRLGVFPRVQNKINLCFNPWKLISSESEELTGLSNDLLEHQGKFSSETLDSINSFLNHNQKPICLVAHNGDNFDYPILHSEIKKTANSLMEGIICIDSIQAFRQLHYAELEDIAKCKETETIDCLSLSIEETEEVGVSGLSQKILDAKKLNETTPKKQLVEMFRAIPQPAKKIKIVQPRKNLKFDVSFKLSDIYTRLTKRSPINTHQAEGDVIMLMTCAATLGDKFVDWANAKAKNFCDIPAMVPGKEIGK